MMRLGFNYEQGSDQAGRFAFELLPPGEYSARTTADKMSPQISPNIRVNIGGVAEIDFKLPIAGARESIAPISLTLSATKASAILGNLGETRC